MKKTSYRFTAPKAPRLSKDFFANRRAEFVKKLPANSVAIIVTGPERTRSNDTEYAYRPSSDVLYLSNFGEPECVLAFVKGKEDSRFIMFVRPKDKMREIWTGIRHGVDGAQNEFGADEAYTIDEFEKVIAPLVDEADTVLYRLGRNEHLDSRFNTVWSKTQKPLGNPEEILHEMRLFKTAHEIDIMRYAGKISAQAHVEAMRLSRPGLMEYQLQASLESVFRFNGADYPAYTSIVGGGNNANILHYIENRAELQDGDLVLIDAACEYQGYASDITRTFPVNGKFTPAQREIYEVVLASQKAAIAMTKPGVRLMDIHETASNLLRKGLVGLGILPKTHLTAEGEKKAIEAWQKKKEAAKTGSAASSAAKKGAGKKAGSKSAAASASEQEPLRLFDFYMHGTSHWIGMDVHDVGTYGTRSQKGKKRPLKPGMVFTVEPGLYIAASETRVPAKYRGIGIRIEDDVAVTAKGFEVLTADVPKEVDEIEAVMADGRKHCEHVEAVFAGRSGNR
ncbi:MAG: aminopeptidase P N-terminal domain-containing protein [Cyanobacteria bacterium REEB67]|nr:aminopeptidase P N-terminal domain-containing protein [Cyanobacteria bacterium REEB67]